MLSQSKGKLRPFWRVCPGVLQPCSWKLTHSKPKSKDSNAWQRRSFLSALYLPNNAPSFASYLNQRVPGRFQAIPLTVEKKLEPSATRLAAELQQLWTEAVFEWTNPADQDGLLRLARHGGKVFARSPPTRLAWTARTTPHPQCPARRTSFAGYFIVWSRKTCVGWDL